MAGNIFKTAKPLFYLAVFFLLGLSGFLLFGIINNASYNPPVVKPSPSASATQKPIVEKQATTTPEKSTETPIPQSLFLPAPFTPQAPTANWDELHNEACEEAGAIMANAYFASSTETSLPANEVEAQIAELTAWQDKTLGYHLDTTSAETARMIESVFGLKTELLANFSDLQIKEALAKGKLVAISENGRLLHNPYYKRPGPLHHMLLIKGFQKDGLFLTNDSGTKRGLNYPYSFETLFEAAADWDHAQNNVDINKKIAILIWK